MQFMFLYVCHILKMCSSVLYKSVIKSDYIDAKIIIKVHNFLSSETLIIQSAQNHKSDFELCDFELPNVFNEHLPFMWLVKP